MAWDLETRDILWLVLCRELGCSANRLRHNLCLFSHLPGMAAKHGKHPEANAIRHKDTQRQRRQYRTDQNDRGHHCSLHALAEFQADALLTAIVADPNEFTVLDVVGVCCLFGYGRRCFGCTCQLCASVPHQVPAPPMPYPRKMRVGPENTGTRTPLPT